MRLSWLVSVWGGVLVSGCLIDFGPGGHEEHDPGPAIVSIATGAEVSLRLETGGLCSDKLGAQCLSERPDTILDVVIGDESVVGLGTRAFDSTTDTLSVDLEGLEPGRTAMEVTYVDWRGEEVVDRYELRVADIARVELDVLCPVWGHDGTVFPVTAGADVPFRHEAFDEDGNALATGRMEVVTSFGGFSTPAPPREDGEIRTAMAPEQVGTHDWTLMGEASETARFPVFLPGMFDLALSETSTFGQAAVRVGRIVDGAPLCVHEGEMRADIDVVAGSCLPLVGGVEILERLPVSLSEDDIEVGLSGVGTCEVRATSAGGSTASLVVEVDNPPPVPEPGNGTALGPSPVEHGGEVEQHDACTVTKNLTNGDCEIVDAAGIILPDPDCLFDVVWRKDHYDPGHPDELGKALVGAELSTELRLKVEYELVGFIPFGSYAPNALTILSMPLGVSIDSHGCNDDGYEVMVLTPAEEGDYTLEISASNAYGPTTFPLQARMVERFVAQFGAEDIEQTAEGTRAWFFVGNRIEPTVRYEDGAGNQLHGTGPLLVSSDDGSAGAAIGATGIDTGVGPNEISVGSIVAPQIHRIAVVDADGVATVAGLDDQQLTTGTEQCFQAHPVGPDGFRIHGMSPVRPQLRLTGDDAVVFELPRLADPDDQICLRGTTPGTINLQVDWSTATVQAAWTVL